MLNSLVHADYYGRQGTIVRRTASMIMFSNPGDMRISFRTAVGGGVSDPRNATLMKMFSLIGIGDRAGMGIPNMIDIWQRLTGYTPILPENIELDMVFTCRLVREEDAKTKR